MRQLQLTWIDWRAGVHTIPSLAPQPSFYNNPTTTQNLSTLTYLTRVLIQCAAVTTQSGLIREPPQIKRPLRLSSTLKHLEEVSLENVASVGSGQ